MKMMSLLDSLPSPRSTLSRITGLTRVDDDCGVTVHRFGRYHRALGPGWHWTVPGIERLGRPVRLTGHHLDVPAGGAHADLYYQILDPARAGPTLERLDQLVGQQVRDTLASITHPTDAPTVAERLKTELNRRVSAHGLRVIRCSLHA